MPSLLGRLFGVSFRTERLIMNIIGLVNSTLDWHPLKWTNKLEQIWSLSLSQRTLIVDTIGEERIKAVLSYIVIARILIAHVFTLSYMTNFYPIVTWSRPNLLLPWLILSFFKNVVLEVIVIAVGLLLWYDKRFSLPIFIEFVLVKVVPLVFATYNWYSNSCLYLELRRMERVRKLRRSMRSDSNLIASRLYLKLAESKYRTRSVTTIISWESYETYDTYDTISRIIEDPNMSPAQKAMKILGVTEHDVDEARARVRERDKRKRLTETEDEEQRVYPRDMSRYFHATGNRYDFRVKTLLSPEHESTGNAAQNEDANNGPNDNESLGHEPASESAAAAGSAWPAEDAGNSKTGPLPAPSAGSPRNNPAADPATSPPGGKPENRRIDPPKATNPMDARSSAKSRGRIDSGRAKRTKPCSSCPAADLNHSAVSGRREPTGIPRREEQDAARTVDDSCGPAKQRPLLACECERELDDSSRRDNTVEHSLTDASALKTSTPNGSADSGNKALSSGPCNVECSTGLGVPKDCANVGRNGNTNSNSKANSNSSSPLDRKSLEPGPGPLRNIPGPSSGSENVEDVVKDVSTSEIDRRMTFSESHGGPCAVDFQSNVKKHQERRESDAEERLTTLKTDGEVARTMAPSIQSAANNATSSGEKSTFCVYDREMDKSLLNTELPEFSFGDTNIPRFYRDSMKVFDGCYEKDFASNAELQCLLQQLEKKKWSLFSGRADYDATIPSGVLQYPRNDRFFAQDFRAAYQLSSEFETIDRYEISVSSSSKANYSRVLSRMVQSSEQSKMASMSPRRDACTQTEPEDHGGSSNGSLMAEMRRRRTQVRSKRKRLKDESRSASPTGMGPLGRKAESRGSCWKNSLGSSLRRKSSRSMDGPKKSPRASRSVSEKSVCECRLEDSNGQSNSLAKADRKCVARCGIDSLATVPLPRVARPSMFDSLYRRKPPAYPRKAREEAQAQTSPSRTSSKMSAFRKLVLESSRKVAERPSAHSSKKSKWKSLSQAESLEEQAAREMRALKAYNEITLLKDKRELEARKRQPLDPKSSMEESSILQGTKARPRPGPGLRPRQGLEARDNLDAGNSRGNASRDLEHLEEHYGDENVFVDATTETELPTASLSREIRCLNAGAKLASISTDKYHCPKLTKVNRVTDRLLENFDRLHGGQGKQDSNGRRTRRRTVETDTRKQYTKYSKPRKPISDQETVSLGSIKKLEGAQNGRELDRTQAKEDVRNFLLDVSGGLESYVVESGEQFHGESMEDQPDLAGLGGLRLGEPPTEASTDGRSVEKRADDLFTTIKATILQDVISSWSSSTVDQADEAQTSATREDAPPCQTSAKAKEASRDVGVETPVEMPQEISPASSTEPVVSQSRMEARLESEVPEERSLGSIQSVRSCMDQRGSPTCWDFARSIEVTCTRNRVILSNPSAPAGQKAQPRSIVDDDTIRMLHHAFSDRSMDFILQLSGEILTVNDMLTPGGHVASREEEEEEFSLQPSRETMGISMEDVPPLDNEERSFEQTILATIRRFQTLQESQESAATCDLYITTVDQGDLLGSAEVEVVNDPELEGDAEMEQYSLDDLGVSDVLPSMVLQVLRCLNVRGLGLERVSGLRYEIIQETSLEDEEEDYRTGYAEEREELEEAAVEKEEERQRGAMIEQRGLRSIIGEDVFTNIVFPISVRLTDVLAQALDTTNEVTDELDIELARAEDSKMNLFSLEEKEEEPGGFQEKLNDPGTFGSPQGKLEEQPGTFGNSQENLQDPRTAGSFQEKLEHPEAFGELQRKLEEKLRTGGRSQEKLDDSGTSGSPQGKLEEEPGTFGNSQEKLEHPETSGDLQGRLEEKPSTGGWSQEKLDDPTTSRSSEEGLQNTQDQGGLARDSTGFLSAATELFSFAQLMNTNRGMDEDLLNFQIASMGGPGCPVTLAESPEDRRCMGFLKNLRRCTVIASDALEAFRSFGSTETLSRTQDPSKDIEDQDEPEVGSSCSSVVIEELLQQEDLVQLIDAEKRIEHAEKTQTGFTSMQAEKLAMERSDLEVYQDAIEFSMREEAEDNDFEELQDQDKGSSDLGQEITVKIVIIFWLLVLHFYLHHFYNKIFSFKQAATSTSTLKPFEIHTVPTSATMLLEKTELLGQLSQESEEHEDLEEEREQQDLLRGLIEPEEPEECSQRSVYHSPLNHSAASRTLSDSLSEDDPEAGSRWIEHEVEKTLMYLSERVTENVRILPFFTSEDSIPGRNESGAISPDSYESLWEQGIPEPRFLARDKALSHDEVDLVSRLKRVILKNRETLLKEKRVELRPTEEMVDLNEDTNDFREEDEANYSRGSHDESFATGSLDGRLNMTFARVKIEEIEESPDRCSLRARAEDNSCAVNYSGSSTQGETFDTDDTGEPDGIVFSRRNNDSAHGTREQNGAQHESAGQILHANMQSTDSFDSTYTGASAASGNTISIVDLNESSMEEFASNASNRSG